MCSAQPFYPNFKLEIRLSIMFAKHCQGFSVRVVQTPGLLQNKPYFKPPFQKMSHSFPLYTVEASNNYR